MRKDDPSREARNEDGVKNKMRWEKHPPDKQKEANARRERGSAVGNRASAFAGHGGPPEGGAGSAEREASETATDDLQVRRWRCRLRETQCDVGSHVQSVHRPSPCIAFHPHSPLWPHLEQGNLYLPCDPLFLFNPAMSLDEQEAHYASGRHGLQSLSRE